jgi:hypothetical protein
VDVMVMLKYYIITWQFIGSSYTHYIACIKNEKTEISIDMQVAEFLVQAFTMPTTRY